MAGAMTTAANMVRALEARGYDREMARVALDASNYSGIEQAAALLIEWGVEQAPVGASVALELAPTDSHDGTEGCGEPPPGDDGYDGDGDDDEEGAVRAPRTGPATPRAESSGDASPVTDAPPVDVSSSGTRATADPHDPATPPSTPPRTSPPPVHSSRGSRPTPTIDLPDEGSAGSAGASVRSAGAAQRQRYAEAALGLAEWDVGTIAHKLRAFKSEIEAGAPVSTISLCLDPATSLQAEPEPQLGVGGPVGAETSPLEEFRVWLKQVNLHRQEEVLLQELDQNNPLKDLATHNHSELGRLVGILELTDPMERMFRRAVELLQENGGRVAAPVMQGDPARTSVLIEQQWAELSDQEKAAASKIGYSQTMWSSFGSLGGAPLCRPTTKFWSELDQDEKVAANLLGFGEIEWDQMLPSSGAAGATLVRQNASPIIGALALESGSAGARKRDSGTLATIEEAAPVAGQNATATGGGLKTPIEPKLEITDALMDMGFSLNAAQRAAIKVNNFGVENAVEWCFAHSDDPDFNDPIGGDEATPPPISLNHGQAHSSTDDEPDNPQVATALQNNAEDTAQQGAIGDHLAREADYHGILDSYGQHLAHQAGQVHTQEASTSSGDGLIAAADDKENVAPAPSTTEEHGRPRQDETAIVGGGSTSQVGGGSTLAAPSVLGPVPTYPPPNLPRNDYVAPDTGTLDGAQAHQHVRPAADDEDNQSRSKRRIDTSVPPGFDGIQPAGEGAVTEMNPAYVPGTTASTSVPQDDWSTEIAKLVEMGFVESECRKALTSSAGDMNVAAQRLLSGPPTADEDPNSKRNVQPSGICIAETTCQLGCKSVEEHMAAAANAGTRSDEGALVDATNKVSAGGSSNGGRQPQPPALPKPNQRRPRPSPSRGSPALNKAQKDQIQKCIQVIALKNPGKQRPAWDEKVKQLLVLENGEALVAEYQEIYSQMIADMADVMISLLRVANEESVDQGETDEPTGGEVSVDAIVVDGSDSPTLQQFIDRVNIALKERDDVVGAAPEPETFHDLCVQLGIEQHESYLALNLVDTADQLKKLASHGLRKPDCEEIGLNDQQRDSILQWANRPVCGLKVAAVSIERVALWHPIISYTSQNLPRDCRQLLHENAENGIADATEIAVNVQYVDVGKQPADGPTVTLRIGSGGNLVFQHATTKWLCLWLEKMLSLDACVYDQDDGNPALRDLAVRNMVEGGGVQTVVDAITKPNAFPGWETMFRALKLLYAIEDPPAAELVDAVISTVESNYRIEMPSRAGEWRYFMLCMSMLCHAAGPRFDVRTILAFVVEEMPSQTQAVCVAIYKNAQRQEFDEQLVRFVREALSEARKMMAIHYQRNDVDHALRRERSAEKLTKQRSKLEEKDATLALLLSEGIDPGTLASEVEEIKGEIDDSEAEISRAEKAAEAADTVEALLVRVDHIVDTIPAAGAAIGKDEEWFLCLLDVVRLPPAPEHRDNDVREIAWRLLKHDAVPVPQQLQEELQRFEIDWETDLFLTIYQLHAVLELLTASANPAWKRGFIREHSHVSHFLSFVRSLDLSDRFLCNIALNDIFGIFQYCIDQLIIFTAEELATDVPTPSPPSPQLQQLMNMGFEEDQSACMLLKCHNRVDVAATHLMDATEPDSDDFSSDEDAVAVELQRSVSVSSASVLRQHLLGDDDGVNLVNELCFMMRKSYDCHVAMENGEMANTLLVGMGIIGTMLEGKIGSFSRDPQGDQMVTVLEAGVCSLLTHSNDKAVRISASSCLRDICDISGDLTLTVYGVLRRGEFKPSPADSAQYFKVLLHMLRTQPVVRSMLVEDILDFVHDWETSLDDLATVNHTKLLTQVLKLDATLIPEHRAVQLMDVLCDQYLLSAPDPPIFRQETHRESACKLLIDIVDTYKDQQRNSLVRLSEVVVETPVPAWKYSSPEDPFDQLVRHSSGLAGLTNKGNTCYMNSSLQQLYALPELREAITHDSLLPAVYEGTEGIRVRVKNKSKFLADYKVSVELISVHPEESHGINKLHLCRGLGYVTGRQEAEVTLASTSKTNTSPFSEVIPPGRYNVVVTDSDDEGRIPFVDTIIDLTPVGTHKANYTLELSGETAVHCNATLKLLPRALQRCMFQLQHSKTAVFDTGEVCNACEELQEFSTLTLEGGIHRQHDAAEFVGVLLEYLEDEMPGTNLLARLKGFFTRTVVTLWFPQDPGHEGTVVPGATEESFGPFGPIDISAKSTGGTLEECMQDSVSAASAMNQDVFTGLEVADGWTTATRTEVIKVLPGVLVMSLGRFKYNMITGRTDKLNYRIEFPQDLDMSPYTEEHIMAARDGRDLPPPCLFELVGVVTHQGTASAGHYFSYAKHNCTWFKLNDERVAEVSIESLEKECFGNGRSNTNAYMLVYRAKDIGAEEPLGPGEDAEAAEKAVMKAKMAALAGTEVSDVAIVAGGAKAGGPIKQESGLTRTTTLSREVDTENQALLRQAELFDEDVLNLILRICRMYLRTGTGEWSHEVPEEERQLVWTVGLNVLSRVLARWKNCPTTLFDVYDWVELLRMAVRPDPWPALVLVSDDDDDDGEEDDDDAIEAATRAAEATETAWRNLIPWLVTQWDICQCAEDWSGLLGSQVDGGLRLAFCALLRAGQTAVVGTADAPIFNALPLAHGGTIGEMLQDQVCAEGVCGSVGYANVDQIELAIDRVLELGGRVNARSVEEALRTVRTAQVKLHRTKRIGVRVWNLLQNESLRVYAVENRDTPRDQWKPLGNGAIAPVKWSTGGPYSVGGSQDTWSKQGTLLMVSLNGAHVAQYTVTGAEQQHVFVQRGEGADPTWLEPEPEPEPDLEASNNNANHDANNNAVDNGVACTYGGSSNPAQSLYGYQLGSKVEVLWQADNRFYAGTVTEIEDDPTDEGIQVSYDATAEYPEKSDEFIRAREFDMRLRKPREDSTAELAAKYANELELLKGLDLPPEKTEADMLDMLDVAQGDVQNAYQFLAA